MKHFDIHEFDCPDCGENHMDEGFLERVDAARERAGIPFPVNSGYRCPKRNAAVGGSPTSSHLTGHAADIEFLTDRARGMAIEALTDDAVGFKRLGIAHTYIHVDDDPEKTTKHLVVWLY